MKNIAAPLFLIVCVLFLTTTNSRAEVFTALVDMVKVLRAERQISEVLKEFVVEEGKRLQKLAEFAGELREFNLTGTNSIENGDDVENYFSNPINTLLFTRKFAVDWKEKIDLLAAYSGHRYTHELEEKIAIHKNMLPGQEDIDGVMDALLRLQETYRLQTGDLVDGRIRSVQYNKLLTANDCFNIGVRAYTKSNFHYAVKWLRQSLELLAKARVDTDSSLTRPDVLDYLAYCLGSTGKYKEALQLSEDLLQYPDIDYRQRIIDNKRWYIERLGQESFDKEEEFQNFQEEGVYTALCRGEQPINQTAFLKKNSHRNLKCFFHGRHYNPFFTIRPLKVEVAFDLPRLYVLHDIIYDKEINHIKRVAAPMLNRATVRNPQTGVLETAQYRISKSAWLPNQLDKVTDRVNNRIKAITGLDIDLAEDLQVVNYGIGGHYSPHFDHGRKRPEDDFDIQRGNRIATLLFYMSDVEAGGATVFVDVGAQLWPQRGSAAFWYNLHRSGRSNDLTRHAACPVLVGSKWVMNKWFRERGQEFQRPCLLSSEA